MTDYDAKFIVGKAKHIYSSHTLCRSLMDTVGAGSLSRKQKKPRRKQNVGAVVNSAVTKDGIVGGDGGGGGISLPGGYACKAGIDSVPEEVAYRVRAYLDELFGTIMLQVKESNSCFDAIPVVVTNILKYNNIHFESVDMLKTSVNIPEPLWYESEVDKRRLILYLNESMYNDYTTTTTPLDVPVVWSCGPVPVDRYNPHSSHPEVSELDPAKIKCAMVCDHVAQHIIASYYSQEQPLANTDLHEGGWTRYGTTLHSMLDIEIVENQCGSGGNGTVNRVLTMLPRTQRQLEGGYGGVGLGLISSREYGVV